MSMASIETVATTKVIEDNGPPKKFVNANLISLKCLLFLFFGGMGCLFPFLPLHMLAVGLTLEEARLVSMISPIVALLGPLTVSPLADKLASRERGKIEISNGRYLRVMIAIACLLSAVAYSLLLLVPAVERIELPRERRPTLKFSCDPYGATVLQERSREFSACYNWTSESRSCSILLRNCNYACVPLSAPYRRRQRPFYDERNNDAAGGYTTLANFADEDSTDVVEGSGDARPVRLFEEEFDRPPEQGDMERARKDTGNVAKVRRSYALPESQPPHLCFMEDMRRICHAYTNFSGSIPVNASFREASNSRERGEWCAYPIAEDITCRIPHEIISTMARYNQTCAVECDLLDPYTLPGSDKTDNQCSQVAGDPTVTFWTYITLRSLADIFPTAAVALLNAAIVIATRETSCGRGDVGRQFAFGSLGFAAFGPLIGYLNPLVPNYPAYFLPIISHVCAMLLAATVAIFSSGMPLSPPEWWWHTRSGMLAVPMSAVKRYGFETAALVFVLIMLGTFWSAMDSYLPLHLANLNGDALAIGVILTVGALPAIFFLWKSENFVDYCGHSNLLIIAFTVYIIRFTGLTLVTDPWWALISEALELFTLGIMWVTAVLYMRHLVPRHLTATAQALPVIAHFCLGRSLGATIGAYVHIGKTEIDSLKFVYQCMALSAAVVAVLYFVLYHGFLKPRCHAQTIQCTRHAPSTVVQGMNGNGNYTPLRVYHNGMAKKGQFRY